MTPTLKIKVIPGYVSLLNVFVVSFNATQPGSFIQAPQRAATILSTTTQLLMGTVTWQHMPLVMFPPTQVELNTVKVIMLFL